MLATIEVTPAARGGRGGEVATVSGGTNLLGELLDGRYRVDAPIARGGMSTVYRGVDTRLDRPVAIKIMDPAFADDPEFLTRFTFEARSVARLSHPALVAVHDQGSDGGHTFLVMELVSGGTLRELLSERGAMPAELALAVLEPVLAALSVAHRAGLVHRDVKPENVLIGDDGAVKVADFGLVRAVAATGSTSRDVILGTAAYLSPEQVSTGAADARSDVYAAGVLAFELLTGNTPYHGDSALSVAYQHVNAEVPAPSSRAEQVGADLDEVVLRATRRDPGQRYHDGGEMLAAVLGARRSLHLPRTRVPTPARSAEHLSNQRRPGVAGTTRALTAHTVRAGHGRSGHNTGSEALRTAGAYQAERLRARRTGIVWFVVVALLTVAVGVGAWWLGSGRFTAVPTLTGLDQTQARSLLAQANLAPVVRTGYDDSAGRDRVLTAQPQAGSRVERGSQVVLTVSLGRPAVPNVPVGTTGADAERALRAVSLQPAGTTGSYDDSVPAGGLLRTDPPAGTVLAVGSPVRLTMSLGPALVAAPDLAGRSLTDAAGVLRAAGLQIGPKTSSFSATVAGGNVLVSDPPAGAQVRRGSTVAVVVSDAVTVPEVRGRSVGTARALLTALGLSVRVTQLLPTDTSLVLRQSVAGGSLVAPGSTITLVGLP